jgi:hypothetical protein
MILNKDQLTPQEKLLLYAIKESSVRGICVIDYNVFKVALKVSSVSTVVKSLIDKGELDKTSKNGCLSLKKDTPENISYSKFLNWIQVNAPNTMKLSIISEEQYLVLVKRFTKELITEKLLAMENTPSLSKKYNSAYLTLSNWCKMSVDKTGKGSVKVLKTGLKSN